MFVIETSLPSYVFVHYVDYTRCFEEIQESVGVTIKAEFCKANLKIRGPTEEICRKALEKLKQYFHLVNFQHSLRVIRLEEQFRHKKYIEVYSIECFRYIYGPGGNNLKRLQRETDAVIKIDKRGSISIYGNSEEDVELAFQEIQSACHDGRHDHHDLSKNQTKSSSFREVSSTESRKEFRASPSPSFDGNRKKDSGNFENNAKRNFSVETSGFEIGDWVDEQRSGWKSSGNTPLDRNRDRAFDRTTPPDNRYHNRQNSQINSISSSSMNGSVERNSYEDKKSDSPLSVQLNSSTRFSAQDVRVHGGNTTMNNSNNLHKTNRETERILVNYDDLSFLIGTKGGKMKSWENQFGVKIDVLRGEHSTATGKVPISVSGSSRANVRNAVEAVLKCVEMLTSVNTPGKFSRKFIIDHRDLCLFDKNAQVRYKTEFGVDVKVAKQILDRFSGMLPLWVYGDSMEIINKAWDHMSELIKENELSRSSVTKAENFHVVPLSFADATTPPNPISPSKPPEVSENVDEIDQKETIN